MSVTATLSKVVRTKQKRTFLTLHMSNFIMFAGLQFLMDFVPTSLNDLAEKNVKKYKNAHLELGKLTFFFHLKNYQLSVRHVNTSRLHKIKFLIFDPDIERE